MSRTMRELREQHREELERDGAEGALVLQRLGCEMSSQEVAERLSSPCAPQRMAKALGLRDDVVQVGKTAGGSVTWAHRDHADRIAGARAAAGRGRAAF